MTAVILQKNNPNPNPDKLSEDHRQLKALIGRENTRKSKRKPPSLPQLKFMKDEDAKDL